MGKFKKGNIGFWKNKKRSQETKDKISKFFKGKTYEEIMGKDKAIHRKNNKEMYKKITKKRLLTMKKKDNFYRPIGDLNVSKRPEVKEKYRLAKLGKSPINKGKNKNNYEPLKRVSEKFKLLYSKDDLLRNKIKKARAKQILPTKDTTIEVKIQNFLKKLNIEFFTHQYIREIEHSYQCDILIPNMNLVIECDGDYWHKYPIGLEKDHIRTKELIEKGFKVLRLWECEIIPMNINEFQDKLKEFRD